MTSYTAVLFDAGGTLWYAKKTLVEVWHEVLAAQGIELPIEQINDAWKTMQPMRQTQGDAFETTGEPTSLAGVQEFLDRFSRQFLGELKIMDEDATLVSQVHSALADNRFLYPETLEVLEELQGRGYRMAIVSNGYEQERTAAQLGVASYFDTIIGSFHVGFRKPMPEIYHMALDRLGIGPQQAIMVGDHWEADVEGPEKVGIKGVHLHQSRLGVHLDRGYPTPGPEAIKDLRGIVRLVDEDYDGKQFST
jgi:HAD superfamily hydrolase (TIGR01662 family)